MLPEGASIARRSEKRSMQRETQMTSRSSIRAIVLALSVALLASCGTPSTVRMIRPGPYAERPENYPILLTENGIDRPYEIIAEVTSSPYDARVLDEAGNAELRGFARKYGGDAVIKISREDNVAEEYGYRPGNLLRMGTKFVTRSTLSGLVVRFTGPDPAPSAR